MKMDGIVNVSWKEKETGLVDVIPNIVYQALDGEEQHIHLFLPDQLYPNPTEKIPDYPLVVYVPGSAWHRQRLWTGLDKAQYFASRGVAFAIAEYRPTDIGAVYPAQIEDIKAAICYLKDHAEKYHINAEKIGLWGNSSGGHTALGIAFSNPEMINCVVSWYAPCDLLELREKQEGLSYLGAESPEGWLVGRRDLSNEPELAKKISPIYWINEESVIPPILLMHGTRDELVPFSQSAQLYQKLKKYSLQIKSQD